MKNLSKVLSFLACSLFIFHGIPQAEELRVQLEDVLSNRKLLPRWGAPIQPVRNSDTYTAIEAGKIKLYKFSNGKPSMELFNSRQIKKWTRETILGEYQVSDDLRYLLLGTNPRQIYRRSKELDYWIFDRKNQKEFRLGAGDAPARDARISPKEGIVAFVQENNLKVAIPRPDGSLEIIPVTTDGKRNEIINGATDWVYEEEFGFTCAHAWSPDGRFLAYLRFDESHVKEYSLPLYEQGVYPNEYRYKYPKVGEENSVVTLHVFDLDSRISRQIPMGESNDQYIPRIKWSPRGDLIALRLNRKQNILDIIAIDPVRLTSNIVHQEKDECYVEEPTDWFITFLPDGDSYIIPSERSGTRQLYLHSIAKPKKILQLTSGHNEICEVYGYDKKRARVLYRAYDSPIRTAIYSVPITGGEPKCLSPRKGTNRALFSSDFSFFRLIYSSATTPSQFSIHDAEGRLLREEENNQALKAEAMRLKIPTREFFQFTTPEGTVLNGYMLKPHGFRESKKYPVLLYQYSGPNSQQVVDEWSVGWNEFLAANECIVVCVDGRGTGGRGRAFRKQTYGRLGDLESKDQIYAARFLAGQKYVDSDRIGIWGWSYGGYMSSLCLFEGNDVFRMAIAVAPVTNWKFYDSIYTERYMGLFSENAKGYDENAPIFYADKLKGKLLLVHGTADDNVHYQNTMELANVLIHYGKEFDMMTYPNRNHGIYGDGARIHLYKYLTKYIDENLISPAE